MTPAQLLARLPKREEMSPPPPPEPCSAGVRYTSDETEDDLSTAVELLMEALAYLQFLRDADKHHDMLSTRMREKFEDHLATVEDFTGRWEDGDGTDN